MSTYFGQLDGGSQLEGVDNCPILVYIYRTMRNVMNAVRSRIRAAAPTAVWTPVDFLDLGPRDTVDKALQRLAQSGMVRRIDRGLYDRPGISSLTKQPRSPDYRQILDALARRDQARMLIDGLTAANDLGLTTAVPARVVVHTDVRRRSIPLGNLTLEFKRTAPSKLYWAGRPAMRVVQALHWLKDLLASEPDVLLPRLADVVADTTVCEDLRVGLPTLPAWMQQIVRRLLQRARGPGKDGAGSIGPARPSAPTRRRSRARGSRGTGRGLKASRGRK
jgi:hypothetical protein